MARYTDSVCKLCRRERQKLFLKGQKCYTEKCPIESRSYPPGEHGQSRRAKVSEYGVQLREKQKIKRSYGLLETQFKNYFEKANRQKGITGENLVKLLERRFDNIVFRIGFAGSRKQARQMIRHRHFSINDQLIIEMCRLFIFPSCGGAGIIAARVRLSRSPSSGVTGTASPLTSRSRTASAMWRLGLPTTVSTSGIR